ncbi:radical SAM protein [Methylotetracoccus oryzae]|uniref:radical SAM protein n=1 Tax=Methylotetracoccus oryzae TaxID=1919059 RepID=UPI00111ABFF8|nr:radical SAM protein [Methylotetracoccus oryzae]
MTLLMAGSINRPELSRRGEIRLGFRCNARCGFCYYQDLLDQPPEKEPTSAALRAGLTALRRLGATEVEFTGGEPTISAELPDLTRFARHLGFSYISLITNGIRLARPSYAEELVAAGINDVLISIHGARAETHDRLTGIPGSHGKAIQAFENLRALGVRCRTTCTVTGDNLAEIEDILALFLSLQASAVHFAVFSPAAQAGGTEAGLRLSYAEAAAALKRAIARHEMALPPLSVKYIPFCYMQGFERYVMNFYQQSFDPDDWNYYFSNRVRRAPSGWRAIVFDAISLSGCLLARHWRLPFGRGLIGMKIYGLTRLIELVRKRRLPACRSCSHDLICDHVWKGYEDVSTIRPIPGKKLTHPAENYVMAAYRKPATSFSEEVCRRPGNQIDGCCGG